MRTLRIFALLLVCAAMAAIILRWISLERWHRNLAQTEDVPLRRLEPTPAPTPTPPRTQVIGGGANWRSQVNGVSPDYLTIRDYLWRKVPGTMR